MCGKLLLVLLLLPLVLVLLLLLALLLLVLLRRRDPDGAVPGLELGIARRHLRSASVEARVGRQRGHQPLPHETETFSCRLYTAISSPLCYRANDAVAASAQSDWQNRRCAGEAAFLHAHDGHTYILKPRRSGSRRDASSLESHTAWIP